jgi:alkylation response protein AidB-like acyl-CoA dehydrogenase
MEGTGHIEVSKAERYLQAAQDLLPLIEAEADASEKLNHQSDKVVAELRRTGIYSMLLPKELGGEELSFIDAMRVTERLSWADGSAGWCTMVAGVITASAAAYLPEKGAEVMYGKTKDVTLAGNGVPRGYARPVEGGYMIRGHWAYGSGIFHAEWVHSGCFVMDGDKMKMGADGAPEIVLMHHPKDTIVLKGNWDTLGLRGTGSFDYTLKDKELFVPDYMCYRFDAPTLMRGGPQYSIGLVGMTAWGHTSWALGVGRRALDEIKRLANERSDVFGLLADSPTFRKSYAEAEAKYRSARAFVYESWNAVTEAYEAGRTATVEEVALIRLAKRHLHDVISEVSTFAHKASRGVSLRPSKLQRAYRDAHSGTQHLLLADEIVMEAGRALLGRTGEGAYWKMFGVQG